MKRILFQTVFMAVIAISACSCGIVETALQIKNETKYECAAVVMADGTVLEGSAILPNGTSANVSFKNSEGEKQKIASSDIQCLYVWREGHEDQKYSLFYNEYFVMTHKKKGDIFRNIWMIPKAVGKHLTIMSAAADIQLNAKGELFIVGETIYYYAFKENDTYGHDLGHGNSGVRNTLIEFLSDDPALCDDLRNKVIKPFDFETICDTYNPR